MRSQLLKKEIIKLPFALLLLPALFVNCLSPFATEKSGILTIEQFEDNEVPPTGLTYGENKYYIYQEQSFETPNGRYEGSPGHFSIKPDLPAGLNLDPLTGKISGTLSMLNKIGPSSYTITTVNRAGKTSIDLTLVFTDWKYLSAISRRPVVIANSNDMDLDGCQIHIEITDPNMDEQCSNLRFVDTVTYREAPHWLAACSGAGATKTAEIWLKPEKLPNKNLRRFDLYFTTAEGLASSGAKTFEAYANMEGNKDTGWTSHDDTEVAAVEPCKEYRFTSDGDRSATKKNLTRNTNASTGSDKSPFSEQNAPRTGSQALLMWVNCFDARFFTYTPSNLTLQNNSFYKAGFYYHTKHEYNDLNCSSQEPVGEYQVGYLATGQQEEWAQLSPTSNWQLSEIAIPATLVNIQFWLKTEAIPQGANADVADAANHCINSTRLHLDDLYIRRSVSEGQSEPTAQLGPNETFPF